MFTKITNSIFGKNMHWFILGPNLRRLGRAQSCLGTFTVNLSSQNFYVNDLGMTRPIFRVPGPRDIAKVEI